MRIHLIPANEYRRERWKNGLGWTREIVRHPVAAEDWDWRLSIAEIDRDCDFSAFEGVDRILVLLSGEGMALEFADGERVELAPPYGQVAFAGERALHCRLAAGPTRDFNLMWRRDRIDADLRRRPLVGPMVFFAEPGTCWAVHLLAGRADFQDRPDTPPMEVGDTAVLHPTRDGRGRVVLAGGGELLVIRLRTREP